MKRLCSLPLQSYDCIGFFGLGKSNLSILNLISEYERFNSPAGAKSKRIILRSEARIDRERLHGFNLSFQIYDGKAAYDNICEKILICSPSVRRERREFDAFRERGVIFSSDCELFFDEGASRLFVVTGSDGKSTTATISSLLLKEAYPDTALIGNIGNPMLKMRGLSESYVAELSSFSLRYLSASFYRAAVTNITPNHLNWHDSFEEYKQTKLSALRSANEPMIMLDDGVLSEYAKKYAVYGIASDKLGYTELKGIYKAEAYITLENGFIMRNGEPILPKEKILRCEAHNIKNLMCALLLCDGYYESETAIRVAGSFSGLSHRAEIICKRNGIDFINSSIDTTPDRCKSTLLTMSKPTVLLLGGRGKGISYAPLRSCIVGLVRVVIAFGEDREIIRESLSGIVPIILADNFHDAVLLGISEVKSGEALLLSPAATSYDEFSSFEERGEMFKTIINQELNR